MRFDALIPGERYTISDIDAKVIIFLDRELRRGLFRRPVWVAKFFTMNYGSPCYLKIEYKTFDEAKRNLLDAGQ